MSHLAPTITGRSSEVGKPQHREVRSLLRVIQPGSGRERTRTQTSCLQGSHTTPPPSAWNSSTHEVNWGTDDPREEKSEFSRGCSASWDAGATGSPSQKRWAEARAGLVHKPASRGLVHSGEERVPGRCWPVYPRDTPKASQGWVSTHPAVLEKASSPKLYPPDDQPFLALRSWTLRGLVHQVRESPETLFLTLTSTKKRTGV